MVFKGLLCRDVNEVALDTQLKTVSLQLLLCQQSTTTTKTPHNSPSADLLEEGWRTPGRQLEQRATHGPPAASSWVAEPL